MSDWKQYFVQAKRTLAVHAFLNRILIETIARETPPNGRILEIGCGTAYLSALLADMDFKVTAGDIDPAVIEYAKTKIQIPANPVTYVVADLFRLNERFQPHEFNTVCHSGVMEHFSDEQIVKSLEQQRGITDKVVFKIPNSRSSLSPEHFGNERFLANREWVRLIRESGFRQVRVIGGEHLPQWAYLLPGVLTLYPKGKANSRRNDVLGILAHWRKWISKHSIFVCES
jgi:SAM-dependent methyltransferase